MILRFETTVNAPIERCFDLSRSIDLHVQMKPAHTAIAGVTTGLISERQTITWRTKIFGIPVTHTSYISEYKRPTYFRDVMVNGRFASFEHQHFLEDRGQHTVMRDELNVRSPLGVLGVIAEKIFVRRFLIQLLSSRNELVKRVAESDEWKRYLPANPS
ncbi:MAG: hypothetical protein JWO13_188 [Acidobacteriales bacterium]|nr:hypothetical protein [Terriglobales bacterium]